MSITPLRDANTEPDQGVVGALKEALELAESGQLRDVSIIGSMIGHRTYTCFYGSDVNVQIGQVSYLLHTLCATKRETRNAET